jgi:hypothetical protein
MDQDLVAYHGIDITAALEAHTWNVLLRGRQLEDTLARWHGAPIVTEYAPIV